MSKRELTDMPNFAYVDGEIRLADGASVSIADRGLLYGFGFFETFRTSGGNVHHWRFNRARLNESCARTRLLLPPSFLACDDAKLARVVRELLSRSGQADAVFRYTVTGGTDEAPTEFLTTRPLPRPVDSHAGIRLRVLKLRRDSGEWIPRPKSLNYLNAILGAHELRSRNAGPSDEGLFLAREDESVVETGRQNIAWVVRDRIHIPDAACGAIDGTCLAWIQTLGLAIIPQRASLMKFLQADAIFALNSVRGITPVAEVWDESDSTRLGAYASADHPWILNLQREWNESLAQTARSRAAQ